MPARLSSLLVRDGLVGVKRMEKAFQRQVIYGGSLDTILLEMNLVPEDRLTQYLALATGLPPASRDEGPQLADDVLALVSSEIAMQFRAIPLSLDGEALRVLVCAPVQLGELEDLADLLDRPLQPLITPEFRWHLVHANAYQLDPPARFTTLARSLDLGAMPMPVGRQRSVIVDDVLARAADPDATAPLVSDGQVAAAADDTTQKVVVDLPLPPTERARTSTLVGVQAALRAPTATGPLPRPQASSAGRPVVEPPSSVPALGSSTGVPQPIVRSRSGAAGRPAMVRGAIEPIATTGRDSPLAAVRARELLATADDRDTVFSTLLRAARARARYAGLLTVQGGAAIGRIALAEIGIDTNSIARVLIPLDIVSPFRAVAHNRQPHVGPLVSGDAGIDAMVLRMGGAMPPSALVMPVVLRERTVALLLAHRVHSDLKLADVTELLPLAAAAADALGRLIVKHKSAGYRTPSGAEPRLELDDERIDTKRHVRGDGAWRSPAPADRPSESPVPASPVGMAEATPPRPITEVLDAIEAGPEGGIDELVSDAIERATETVGELAKRFPGKLRVERFSVTGRPLRAAQSGGLLELVVRLGSAAAELIVDRMSAPQRDIRFYATLCAAELRPRTAVFALAERLFDQDYGVRDLAMEALAGYPEADRTHALAKARHAVHATDPETVAAATAALVHLGDIDAIEDLIAAIDRGARGAEHARKALVALTAQDFGLSEKKWRKWFDGARRRHRIEWLIDGLAHKDDAIRESSINELRRLTGEYFGYHHDLPRKEREVAAKRWSSWWRETGMRRFVSRDDERHRPTAVLPVRRD